MVKIKIFSILMVPYKIKCSVKICEYLKFSSELKRSRLKCKNFTYAAFPRILGILGINEISRTASYNRCVFIQL